MYVFSFAVNFLQYSPPVISIYMDHKKSELDEARGDPPVSDLVARRPVIW